MMRVTKPALWAITAISAMLLSAAPLQAATLISEVFVPGVASGTIVTNSTDPGFNPQLNQNLAAGGVVVDTSINLASGSLRGTVNSVGSSHAGNFNLSLTEQFAFAIPGATGATVTRLGLRVYFAADMAVSGASRVSLANRIFTGPTSAGSDVILTSGDFRPFYAYGNGFSYPDLPVTRGGLGELAGVFEHILYFDVVGANPDVFLATNVQAQVAANSLLDFGNSAHIGFVLPEGVTFTSSSGVALTKSAFPGAVPEPASWAMLIAGFGLSGAMLRRRRWVAAQA